jgi:hypothetical protein
MMEECQRSRWVRNKPLLVNSPKLMSYLNKQSQELYRKADDLLGTLLAKLDCDQMLDNKSDPEREYKAATLFFLTKAVKPGFPFSQ